MALRRRMAAVALATAAAVSAPGAARAEQICVKVTVIGPLIGTISTGYTCTNSPVSTWYRDIGWGAGGFEVIVEVVSPAGDSR